MPNQTDLSKILRAKMAKGKAGIRQDLPGVNRQIAGDFVGEVVKIWPVDTGRSKRGWRVIQRGAKTSVENRVGYSVETNTGTTRSGEGTAKSYPGTPYTVLAWKAIAKEAAKVVRKMFKENSQ